MLRWNEVQGSLWTIPAERMKAGVAHRIPLPSRCLEILDLARKISRGSEYIFEGTKPNKPLSENTFNKLIKDLGLDVHAHGFRTSFRTWTQEKTNYPREIAEAALAHSLSDKAEAAYARSDLLEKRAEMMEAWAQFLSASGSKISDPDKGMIMDDRFNQAVKDATKPKYKVSMIGAAASACAQSKRSDQRSTWSILGKRI